MTANMTMTLSKFQEFEAGKGEVEHNGPFTTQAARAFLATQGRFWQTQV
jgi:hypothetical protein